MATEKPLSISEATAVQRKVDEVLAASGIAIDVRAKVGASLREILYGIDAKNNTDTESMLGSEIDSLRTAYEVCMGYEGSLGRQGAFLALTNLLQALEKLEPRENDAAYEQERKRQIEEVKLLIEDHNKEDSETNIWVQLDKAVTEGEELGYFNPEHAVIN